MQNFQSECLRCFLLPPLATTPFWLYPSLRAEGQEEKSHGRLLASTAMQWCKLDQVWTLVSEWNWFYSQSPVHLWSILVFGMWIRLQDALTQYGWNISLPSLVPESNPYFCFPLHPPCVHLTLSWCAYNYNVPRPPPFSVLFSVVLLVQTEKMG